MLYYLLSIILIVIDQIVKLWIRANIPLGQSIPFIPYVMNLTYTRNTGAAFSSFSGMTWVLTLVSLVCSVAIAVMMWKKFFPGFWGRLSLSLILAGAVGNLIDRAFMGYVTDMFETTFMNFAVFNVADVCVVAGGFAAGVYYLFLMDRLEGRGREEAPHDDAEADR